MSITRRRALQGAAATLLFSALGASRTASSESKSRRAKHTFVFITLQGGVDHAQYLPVFLPSGELSPHIHFPTSETFERNGIQFLSLPTVLQPTSPLVDRYGSKLAVLSGVQMDNQNAHNAALAVLMRGVVTEGAPSFASVVAELTGHDTRMGLVSFGTQPFQNAAGLSEKGMGFTVPAALSDFASQLRLPDNIGETSAQEYLDAVSSYARLHPESPLNAPAQNAPLGSTLAVFRKYFRDLSVAERLEYLELFQLEPNTWQPYASLVGPYGNDRYEQFAMAAQLIGQGNIASTFVINVGRTEGFYSYDTHNSYTGNNDARQQEKLNRDLRALEIFMAQIEPYLDSTTILVGTEFGRPPQLNATGGRDHWGFNNTLLVWSPLLRQGLHGRVDPSTFEAAPVPFRDGSQEPLRCRSLYRGLLESIFANGLMNTDTDTANRLYRQVLSGAIPSGVFVNV
jgi:uncharacterized protein (DUF1501 family)